MNPKIKNADKKAEWIELMIHESEQQASRQDPKSPARAYSDGFTEGLNHAWKILVGEVPIGHVPW